MSHLPIILSLLMAAVPTLYLGSALNAHFRPQSAPYSQFWFSLAALVAASLTTVWRALSPDTHPLPWLSPAPVSLAMLMLVSFIGVIISRYSQNYLSGEPHENRYYRNLHLTLTAVALVVVSNNLILLLISWIAISLGLHQLLMFYPERPRAALAAHKKFLFARLAETSLFCAALLLHAEHNTWRINDILATYSAGKVSLYDQLAAALLAIAALIKCAQLPVHGWLIQVVEAPTPVSALLHAGIINLGGFLLILFAPLLSKAPAAQWLLLIFAGLTTLLSGLIMMTRVSVKVRLAWSTSAQMGLMLVECALGLYPLAMLHLLAHSCYKAYAFLNAGSAVELNLYRQLSPSAPPTRGDWILAITLAAGLISAPMIYFAPHGPYSPWLLLMFTLSLVLAERSDSLHTAKRLSAIGLSTLLIAAYALQKTGASWIAPVTPHTLDLAADLWFCLLMTLLFSGYVLLRYAPQSRVGRRLWHILYAGLYLDEWATRTTLAIWPTQLPVRANPKQSPPLFSRESLS